MSQITLNILAEDIKTTNYTNCSDCAITRALQRGGYEGWKDTGLSIKNEKGEEVIHYNENPQYKNLSDKVVAMYGGVNFLDSDFPKPIEPEDFECIINY